MRAVRQNPEVAGVLSARRFVAALAAMSMVGLGSAACSTPSATAAAQVGDVSISEAAIFDRTSALVAQAQEAGNAPDASAIAAFNRSQTTSAIRSQLLEIAAADAGVVVTDEQVNAAIAAGTSTNAATELGAPQAEVEQAVRDLLTVEGLVSRQPPGGVPVTDVIVTIDGVAVPTRDEAVATRSQFLSDPQSVDAVIAASVTPIQPQAPLSILTQPADAATGVFYAMPGEVILYAYADGYFVVRILDRTVQPAVLTAADLQSQQQLGAQFDLAALLLEPYAQSAGVRVNPRLGVWDPLTLQVVPGGSGL